MAQDADDRVPRADGRSAVRVRECWENGPVAAFRSRGECSFPGGRISEGQGDRPSDDRADNRARVIRQGERSSGGPSPVHDRPGDYFPHREVRHQSDENNKGETP